MPESVISSAMAAAVGTELVRLVSHPVSESDIRRWAIAVYWPAPPPTCYTDEKAAHGGIVAPEEFNPFAWTVAERALVHPLQGEAPSGADATERMAGVPGPGLKFQLNGGMSTEYGERMRPGDVVTSVRRLGSYTERQGRLGLMLFTATEDTWTNQRDELVKHSVNTLIRY